MELWDPDALYKLKIFFFIVLLPSLYYFPSGIPLEGWGIIVSGLVVFVVAESLRNKKSPLFRYLSVAGETLYILGVIGFTGLYVSPFLILLFIPSLTRALADGPRWDYIFFLFYSPFMLFLAVAALINRDWSGMWYSLVFWVFLFVTSITITQYTDVNAEIIRTLNEKAVRDPLTGLFNRYILEEVYKNIESGYLSDTLTLVMLDLDNFKMKNDTLGHQAGDDLLRRIAGILRDNMRNRDYYPSLRRR
jgi:hypothetical protein